MSHIPEKRRKPCLTEFLLERLRNPDLYSHLINWVDESKLQAKILWARNPNSQDSCLFDEWANRGNASTTSTAKSKNSHSNKTTFDNALKSARGIKRDSRCKKDGYLYFMFEPSGAQKRPQPLAAPDLTSDLYPPVSNQPVQSFDYLSNIWLRDPQTDQCEFNMNGGPMVYQNTMNQEQHEIFDDSASETQSQTARRCLPSNLLTFERPESDVPSTEELLRMPIDQLFGGGPTAVSGVDAAGASTRQKYNEPLIRLGPRPLVSKANSSTDFLPSNAYNRPRPMPMPTLNSAGPNVVQTQGESFWPMPADIAQTATEGDSERSFSGYLDFLQSDPNPLGQTTQANPLEEAIARTFNPNRQQHVLNPPVTGQQNNTMEDVGLQREELDSELPVPAQLIDFVFTNSMSDSPLSKQQTNPRETAFAGNTLRDGSNLRKPTESWSHHLEDEQQWNMLSKQDHSSQNHNRYAPYAKEHSTLIRQSGIVQLSDETDKETGNVAFFAIPQVRPRPTSNSSPGIVDVSSDFIQRIYSKLDCNKSAVKKYIREHPDEIAQSDLGSWLRVVIRYGPNIVKVSYNKSEVRVVNISRQKLARVDNKGVLERLDRNDGVYITELSNEIVLPEVSESTTAALESQTRSERLQKITNNMGRGFLLMAQNGDIYIRRFCSNQILFLNVNNKTIVPLTRHNQSLDPILLHKYDKNIDIESQDIPAHRVLLSVGGDWPQNAAKLPCLSVEVSTLDALMGLRHDYEMPEICSQSLSDDKTLASEPLSDDNAVKKLEEETRKLSLTDHK